MRIVHDSGYQCCASSVSVKMVNNSMDQGGLIHRSVSPNLRAGSEPRQIRGALSLLSLVTSAPAKVAVWISFAQRVVPHICIQIQALRIAHLRVRYRHNFRTPVRRSESSDSAVVIACDEVIVV